MCFRMGGLFVRYVLAKLQEAFFEDRLSCCGRLFDNNASIRVG